jgi:hypothetical protein
MSKLMQIRYGVARSSALRAPLLWLRHRGLDSNDVFLGSYARSGSTLPRFLLAEALTGSTATFDDIQQVVPEIGIHVRAKELFPGGGHLIKTHERYRGRYKKAIYIVRDVRDVMLSAFAREKGMDLLKVRSLDDYVEPFMQGNMVRYGPWQDHVREWLDSPLAKRGGLLVLRYEDLRTDLVGSFARTLQFLNLEFDAAAIQKILENNSMEKMRKREDAAIRLPKTGKEEGRQVGKGAVQGWRQTLSQEKLEIVDRYAGDVLRRLGYPTASEVLEGKKLQPPPMPLPPAGVLGLQASAVTRNGFLASIRRRRKAIGGTIADRFSWYRY